MLIPARVVDVQTSEQLWAGELPLLPIAGSGLWLPSKGRVTVVRVDMTLPTNEQPCWATINVR